MTHLSKTGLATAAIVALFAGVSAANADSGFYASSFTGLAVQRDQASQGAGQNTDISFDNGFVIGGALGYKFDPSFLAGIRVELEVAYRENNVDAGAILGDPGAAFRGDNSSLGVFGNVLYEISGVPLVTPYIGAGLGIGGVESDTFIDTLTNVRFGGATRTEFLYQGIVGLTLPLTDTWDVFAEGRYYAAPGADFDLIDTVTNTRQTLESNYEVLQLQAGVRFKF